MTLVKIEAAVRNPSCGQRSGKDAHSQVSPFLPSTNFPPMKRPVGIDVLPLKAGVLNSWVNVLGIVDDGDLGRRDSAS